MILPGSHFKAPFDGERLRKRLAAFSGKNFLAVVRDYAPGHFCPAALPAVLLARSRYESRF